MALERFCTKEEGLKVLAHACKGVKHVSVAPFVVTRNLQELDLRKLPFAGADRLLVRTDPLGGTNVHALEWQGLPQAEIDLKGRVMDTPSRTTINDAFSGYKFLVHPLPSRDKVALAITLHYNHLLSGRCLVSAARLKPDFLKWRFLTPEGCWTLDSGCVSLRSGKWPSAKRGELLAVNRVLRVARRIAACDDGAEFELRAATYKDAPSRPEFFDLRHARHSALASRLQARK